MAVVIRLQRVGKPKQPYYRVVAVDSRVHAKRKPIEILGSYNPRADKAKDKVQVKQDRIEYWLNIGAKPSETVATLLKAASKRVAEDAQAEAKAAAEVEAKAEAETKADSAAETDPEAAADEEKA
ncbi:MAG: 30S ribosomal protein S16 [Elusimicrobiota bacterium]